MTSIERDGSIDLPADWPGGPCIGILPTTYRTAKEVFGLPEARHPDRGLTYWTVRTPAGMAVIVDDLLGLDELESRPDNTVHFDVHATSAAVLPWFATAIAGNTARLHHMLKPRFSLRDVTDLLTGYAQYLIWQCIAIGTTLSNPRTMPLDKLKTKAQSMALLVVLAARTAGRAFLPEHSALTDAELLERSTKSQPRLPIQASDKQISEFTLHYLQWLTRPTHRLQPIKSLPEMGGILLSGADIDGTLLGIETSWPTDRPELRRLLAQHIKTLRNIAELLL
ncbi:MULTISPECIES: hypothetical protein [unclassified Crossiella]|uniref:hypothetical protein n=1 Tax=unclassified Crossiella TaxID=2620835 RepID=UPI001FFE4D19|nr:MULTISPECIES: hypothetical protein [unclassified Crossiella]MCK2239996.1 hypothetical protein [Crossiella sp. S99.2]MCK2252704.1 hypothetical protein [Crossiella sp. S99.1]